MSDEQTHYEVLGLPQDATADQIRKRFRELARKHHPDLNPHRLESHELFLRINHAYEVLSDPSRRAAYDLDLRDRARRSTEFRSGGFGSAPHQTPGTSTRPPAGSSYRPTGTPPGAGRGRGGPDRERRHAEAIRLVERAHQEFRRGNIRESQRLVRESLEVLRTGAAYELLGDIAARQGRPEEALQQYTIAAQMIPQNARVMAKLTRMADRVPARSGAEQNPLTGLGYPQPRGRRSFQLAVSFFGLALILLLMAWRPSDADDVVLNWSLVPHWTLLHVVMMGLCGFVTGSTVACAGWVRPMDRELFLPAIGGGRVAIPLGIVLAVTGILFMPAALVIYILAAHRQDSVSPSVLGVFGLTVLLTFGFFALGPDRASMETLLFGGNVIFEAALWGWFFGDLFRPGWAG